MNAMTTDERIARLAPFASKVRGVGLALGNVRHAQGWREDHPDIAYWLDAGECYAGLITDDEFSALHAREAEAG